MNVTVRVDTEQYEVQIADLYARPIIAVVDGRRYEVWLEETPVVRPAAAAPATPAGTPAPVPTPAPAPAAAAPAATPAPTDNGAATAILAPIPGVIVEIAVRPGDQVEPGQQVCVLEAMKMKNIIRSPRSGTIREIRVSTGQHVKHHDLLMEFAD